jgi:hypothetical protein
VRTYERGGDRHRAFSTKSMKNRRGRQAGGCANAAAGQVGAGSVNGHEREGMEKKSP